MTSRPNILYLVHRVPYPPNRGDRIRSYNLLNYLSERANVYLGTLADEPLEPDTRETLEARCEAVAIEFLGGGRWWNGVWSLLRGGSATSGLFVSPNLRRQIEAWTAAVRFDAVVVFCSSMVQYLHLPKLRNVPTVVDLVDVDSQKFFDYVATARAPQRWLYQLEAQRLRALERSLPNRVQAITLVSEAEAAMFREFCPNQKTFAVTNGVDLEYFQSTATEPQPERCVFVGAFDYLPNIDGAVWFCQEAWPLILAKHPRATFALVGRNPDPAVRRLANLPGVEVVGSVPDVRPYMEAASLIVVPLRIARGIQNKVLEAFAMRKPVIASPPAIEGLAVTPSVELAQAESAAQWSSSISTLFSDAAARQRIANAGHTYVHEAHNWSTCLAKFSELLALDRSAPSLNALDSAAT